MEARGLVTVTPDPDDGGAVVVRRTDEGDRVLANALRRIGELERDLAELVGTERYAEFREVLDELAIV